LFSVKCWPDGALVYDRETGDTHALTSVAGALLAVVQEAEAISQRSLLVRLAPVFPELGEAELLRQLLEAAQVLRDRGLWDRSIE
jgi:PqqD family protein of HPr-rel-A system